MKPQEWDFTMALRVHDAETLRRAALKHEDAAPDDTFLDDEGNVDIQACLIMLLDPGTVPGCSVHESTADRQQSYGIAGEEDEQSAG